MRRDTSGKISSLRRFRFDQFVADDRRSSSGDGFFPSVIHQFHLTRLGDMNLTEKCCDQFQAIGLEDRYQWACVADGDKQAFSRLRHWRRSRSQTDIVILQEILIATSHS